MAELIYVLVWAVFLGLVAFTSNKVIKYKRTKREKRLREAKLQRELEDIEDDLPD